MDSFKLVLRAVASLCMLFAMFALAGIIDTALPVADFIAVSGITLASLLPATLADPQIMKQWSQKYFQRVQSKSIFDEGFTGTTFVEDGPKKSQLVKAPPITLITDLQNRSGNVVTHTMIEPMFLDSLARMNYARLKQQVREGTEKSLNRKFIKFPIASAFWGIKEEDVLIGRQENGMANLTSLMTKGLSDNTAAYMDDDLIEAFLTGYSRHLFATIAEINDVADASPVNGSADLGVLTGMSEHPNTYAWTPTGLVKAASNSSEDIATAFDQITTAATPDAALLNQISLVVKLRKIPGVVLVGGKFKSGRNLVRVICDPLVMNELRSAADYKEAVNHAYMSKGDDHPLIAQGDILWGRLWITEEEKLLDEAFSNKWNFNSDGFTDTGVSPNVVHSDPATVGVVGTKGSVDRVITIDKGQRFYRGSDGAIGATGADKIGNILVLGANSLGRVPGPVLKLIPRVTNDYKRIIGLGSEHIFGHKRLDFTDQSGAFSLNQSSVRIMAFRGEAANLV